MIEVKNSLEEQISFVADKFLEKSKNKEIQIISHFDTDGITSATIMAKTLKKMDKRFSVKIIKSLEKDFINTLPTNRLTIFLDLASGSLEHINNSDLEDVFIIDHHEIIKEIPNKIKIINPELHDKKRLSASSLTYLFCKQISPEKNDLAKLAILGMIGDQLDQEIGKINNGILEEGEIKRKRGLLIYPSTRPINRVLEFCSSPYIPGITGNPLGVLELLREAGLKPTGGKYKNLIELNKEEMEKLTTAIILRNPKVKNRKIIGDIFLIKMFNKLEDTRELSAMINACSRFGRSDIALQVCMEISKAKKQAETIYAKYKQLIISGLNTISKLEKQNGKKFVIINAKNNIKDTIIGTLASILSYSSLYEEGTIIVAMAYYEDKIKVSARIVGKNGRNLRELLSQVIDKTKGEVGGHKCAAGCIVCQEKENEFLNILKKSLEVEVVKV